MRIAQIGVNEKSLPSKEWLIEAALKSKKYINLPRKKALTLINQEIKKSGLYKPNKKESKKPIERSRDTGGNRNKGKRAMDKKKNPTKMVTRKKA